MQGVLRFEEPLPRSPKRRKNARACQRCQAAKKRCIPRQDSQGSCERCLDDRRPCSFDAGGQFPSSPGVERQSARGGTGPVFAPLQAVQPLSPSSLPAHPHDGSAADPAAHLTRLDTARVSALRDSERATTEMRYSTMLDIIHGDHSASAGQQRNGFTKLIGDSNPLSALLRKDLKDKIVNNLCAFRSPDPLLGGAQRPSLQRLPGTSAWDWEGYYAASHIHPAKWELIRALGCFKLPNSNHCGALFDIYFTRIHPMLPIVDRREFLAQYYGGGQPPPLVLLLAIFLAAARYSVDAIDAEDFDGRVGVREICDVLHTRLRALVDVDVLSERLAVLQAMILASLHWEGREGINSALDSLTMAVRIAQEMGLHRENPNSETSSTAPLLKRIWWCTFALDRFNAATEGTTFLINESDCDVQPLQPSDFLDEDGAVAALTLVNVELALIVQDAVRSFYTPGVELFSIHSRFGERQRDRLTLKLNRLRGTVAQFTGSALENEGQLLEYWSVLLNIHIQAVTILVHRPFLLHRELNGMKSPTSQCYYSRALCRSVASNLISFMILLRNKRLINYSWPFTVYSTVNALLLVWYDYSAPSPEVDLGESRRQLLTIIGLLRDMGSTWWAAAAKQKLAEALLRIGSRLREKTQSQGAGAPPPPQVQTYGNQPVETDHANVVDGNLALGTIDSAWQEYLPPMQEMDDALLGEDPDFWASLGLDFESDLAQSIFSIS